MPSKKEFLESLDVVSEVAPILKSLIVEGSYRLTSEKKGDMIQVIDIVKIYSILKKEKELIGRNLEVLAFYLVNGYNRDLKEKMAEELDIKINNVNQINSSLRKDGYLIQDKKNKTKNVVDPDLKKFKEFIIDKEKKNVIIEFI